MYHVMMCHEEPGTCAHLRSERRYTAATQCVRWQAHTVPHPTYPICKYDPATGEFVEMHGEKRRLKLTRGAYTEAAFEEFKASLPQE